MGTVWERYGCAMTETGLMRNRRSKGETRGEVSATSHNLGNRGGNEFGKLRFVLVAKVLRRYY